MDVEGAGVSLSFQRNEQLFTRFGAGTGGRGGGRGGERNRGDRAPKNRTEGHATRKRQYDRKSGTGRSGV